MSGLALAAAVLIGLSLGLTGAGGSILTLPILVYLAGIAPRDAVAMSLLVVGAVSLVGAIQRAWVGEVHYQAMGWFSLAGMAGAAVGARFTHWVSADVLLMMFAVLMVVVGLRMWMARPTVMECGPECRPVRCFFAGAMVGVLTGFLGVGGGFLLMPALVRFAKLPMGMAMGTSLAVIAFNSLAGFLSHAGEAKIQWVMTGVFVVMAVAGVLAGGVLAKRLPERLLKRVFGGLVLVTALVVFWSAWI